MLNNPVSAVSLRCFVFEFTGILLDALIERCIKKLLTQNGNKLLVTKKLYLDCILKC